MSAGAERTLEVPGGTQREADARALRFAAQRKISRPEAQAQVTQAKQRFVDTKNQAVATAKSAADTAAGAASKTSFILVLALLVGAGAAAFGATAATRRRVR